MAAVAVYCSHPITITFAMEETRAFGAIAPGIALNIRVFFYRHLELFLVIFCALTFRFYCIFGIFFSKQWSHVLCPGASDLKNNGICC